MFKIVLTRALQCERCAFFPFLYFLSFSPSPFSTELAHTPFHTPLLSQFIAQLSLKPSDYWPLIVKRATRTKQVIL